MKTNLEAGILNLETQVQFLVQGYCCLLIVLQQWSLGDSSPGYPIYICRYLSCGWKAGKFTSYV